MAKPSATPATVPTLVVTPTQQTATQAVSRTIARGANPFAPMVRLRNQSLTTPHNKYEKLVNRAIPVIANKSVISAIDNLKERLNGQIYDESHFGTLEWIDIDLIDINVDIQRLVEQEHIARHIIELFDPRIMQPINVIRISSTGRYSAWEGQQSGTSVATMKHYGLFKPGTRLPCKVVRDDLTVPGTNLIGEAVGNYGFRCINGVGRKSPDVFYVYRSMVNGVRLYNSTLREDTQAEEIQQILEKNHMFPSAAVNARGQNATPGMVTYITGVEQIAGHDTSKDQFDTTKNDLNWALQWHDTYFSNEKGVDGGFILAFGRLAAEAREAGIVFDKNTEDDFYRHMKARYGSPKGFHSDCKTRLSHWQNANNLKDSWSDTCLTPIFIADYINDGGQCIVPQVKGMVTYGGI